VAREERGHLAFPGISVTGTGVAKDTVQRHGQEDAELFTNLEIAARRLLRSPVFSVVAIVTLAVGVGASAAIFSVVQAVLIDPLSYPEADSLVGVWHSDPEHEKWQHAHISYLFYREQNRVFDEMGLFQRSVANLTGNDRPVELPAVEVTPSLLRVLGTQPLFGRMFLEEEGEAGADPTVIVSHSLWQRSFGGDQDVLGTSIRIDGVSREVVGVMPPGFRVSSVNADLLLPMEIDRSNPERGLWGNTCVARLRPDRTLAAAQDEMDALVLRVHEAFPNPEATRKAVENARIGVLVTPLKEDVVGGVAEVLWILFGCVGVVLVISVANVANLFLVRAEVRQQETALRSALGATRTAIARDATVESLMVTVAGSTLGLALAAPAIKGFLRFAPPGIPRLDEVAVDLPVVLFALAIAALSGFVFGAVPALRRKDRHSTVLRDGGRGATGGRARHRIRDLLVVSQLALALMLMVLSGLMVRSFFELRAADTGCDPQGVVTVRLPISGDAYAEPAEALGFYNEVLEKVRAVPGVDLAGASTGVPVADGGILLGHSFEDSPLEEDEIAPNYITHLVLPDALEVLGIPVLAGRGLGPEDRGGETRSVMISESLARRVWPDPADAVGRRVMPGRPQDGGTWYTIIGVVGDAPYGGLADGKSEALYYPFWSLRVNTQDRFYTNQLELVIKTPMLPTSLARAVADKVWSVDPHVPVANIRTLDEVVAEARVRTRFTMMLLLAAACIAMVLGAVGLYGAISYVVSLRTREIGVRMALGADPIEVRCMVLRRGLVLALTGVVLGLTGALMAGRIAVAQLYGVSPADPITFGLGSVLIIGVALLASYLPARRAAAMDPLDALRYE
jgi:predicted permease